MQKKSTSKKKKYSWVKLFVKEEIRHGTSPKTAQRWAKKICDAVSAKLV